VFIKNVQLRSHPNFGKKKRAHAESKGGSALDVHGCEPARQLRTEEKEITKARNFVEKERKREETKPRPCTEKV